MPGRVSCRLYLLLDALENFDIKFSKASRSKYNRQETHTVIIFYIYYIPVIFLAQTQASHVGEIQHDGKKIHIYTQ